MAFPLRGKRKMLKRYLMRCLIKKAFANLIDAGLIYDMFVSESFIGDQAFPIIKFVMEADSEEEVRRVIGNLPLQF